MSAAKQWLVIEPYRFSYPYFGFELNRKYRHENKLSQPVRTRPLYPPCNLSTFQQSNDRLARETGAARNSLEKSGFLLLLNSFHSTFLYFSGLFSTPYQKVQEHEPTTNSTQICVTRLPESCHISGGGGGGVCIGEVVRQKVQTSLPSAP